MVFQHFEPKSRPASRADRAGQVSRASPNRPGQTIRTRPDRPAVPAGQARGALGFVRSGSLDFFQLHVVLSHRRVCKWP